MPRTKKGMKNFYSVKNLDLAFFFFWKKTLMQRFTKSGNLDNDEAISLNQLVISSLGNVGNSLAAVNVDRMKAVHNSIHHALLVKQFVPKSTQTFSVEKHTPVELKKNFFSVFLRSTFSIEL